MDMNVAAFDKRARWLRQSVPIASKLPNYLRIFISNHGIQELTTDDEKARAVLSYLYTRPNIGGRQVITLFQACKSLFFNNTSVIPNAQTFAQRERRKEVRPDNMNFFYEELQVRATTDDSLIPLVTLFKTVLRPSELLQLDYEMLVRLVRREKSIPMDRKRGSTWTPNYHFENLGDWVDFLGSKYNVNKYGTLLAKIPIFNISYSALQARMKRVYSLIFHKVAPFRFGLHAARYYWASILTERNEDPTEISKLLGHSDPKTLQIYIKPDFAQEQKTLNDAGNLLNQYLMDQPSRTHSVPIESFDLAEFDYE